MVFREFTRRSDATEMTQFLKSFVAWRYFYNGQLRLVENAWYHAHSERFGKSAADDLNGAAVLPLSICEFRKNALIGSI